MTTVDGSSGSGSGSGDSGDSGNGGGGVVGPMTMAESVAKYQYDMTQNGAYSSADSSGGGGGTAHRRRKGMTMVEGVGSGKGVWAVAISQPIKSMFFRRS